jgi:peptidyl-prolyl cis-trans isomerase B (cyclophilin B)
MVRASKKEGNTMKKLILCLGIAGLLWGCGGGTPETEEAGGGVVADAPVSTPERPIVILETDSGRVVTELYPHVAPVTCDSILSLVNQGFYNGLTFHRIVPGFVIQGGDPQGTGTGNAGFQIPAEFSDQSHIEGALSMARSPANINSSSCQFFICLAPIAHLDGQYNLFGQVIEGMDVVHKLERIPTGAANRPTEPVYIRRMFENK